MANKEEVYDTQINPLVAQIIEICEKNGISFISSFCIPTEVDPDLVCTTILPDENGKIGPHYVMAARMFGAVF